MACFADQKSQIKVQNQKTLELSEVSGALKKDQKLVTCLQMFVRDNSNLSSGQFAKVTLIDDGTFWHTKPADIQAKKASLKEIKERLLRFNVWLECGVKISGDQLVITDSTLKKY